MLDGKFNYELGIRNYEIIVNIVNKMNIMNRINQKIKGFTVLLFYGLAVFFVGCKEEGRLDHIDDSAPAPSKVTVVEVKNLPGAAVIKYKVPKDRNLAGVVAVYERNGEICETKASVYVDSLVAEGFGNTDSRIVKVMSIGWNGKMSEAEDVPVRPLEPPVLTAAKQISSTFGGVAISFSNAARANLAIVLMTDTTEMDFWYPLQTFYTKADTGKFYRRGLKAKEQRFAVYFRDRWNNKSDTIIQYLTPEEELLLPKNTFTNQRLSGDTWQYIQMADYAIEGVWDNVIGTRVSNIFASLNEAPMPQHFTISLGYRAMISRFKVYHRLGDEYFGASPRTWELWGSDNPPRDGSWDNWYLLGEFYAFKPSGYDEDGSVGAISEDDKAYCRNEGIDCELTVTDKVEDPFREVTHLRFKTTATFNTYGTDAENGQLVLAELTFWGQIKN